MSTFFKNQVIIANKDYKSICLPNIFMSYTTQNSIFKLSNKKSLLTTTSKSEKKKKKLLSIFLHNMSNTITAFF